MKEAVPNHGPTATGEDLYAVIRLVRPLFKQLHRAVEANLEGTGVSVSMRAVMERLDEDGPQTVPQIARALSVPRQFTQLVANELISSGRAELLPNGAHRRSPLVRLTEAGSAAFAAIRSSEMANTSRIAAQFPAAELEICRQVLREVTLAFAALNRERAACSAGGD